MSKQSTVFAVDVRELQPNPANPRSDLGDLSDLAESIQERGILSPLLAMRSTGRLSLLAGHRRLAAAKAIGMTHVPVLIVGEQLPDDQLVIALAENMHRAPLPPLDEARACQALLDMGRTRGDVALELHRSGNWVADRLGLLELPGEVAAKIEAGEMTLGSGAALGKALAKQRKGSVVVGLRSPYHFTNAHPLAKTARAVCDAAGHPTTGRVGPVCGACWETAIRADERQAPR